MNKLTKNELSNYKKLSQKKYRQANQKFIIEGEHLIEEALKCNGLLEMIITSDENFVLNNIKIKYCSYQDICKLSTTKTPQQYIGICNFIKSKELKNDFILALDNINDPGNLGTIIRTAYSFGVTEIIVEGVDIYNPKVLRASQGAIFNVNIYNEKNLYDKLILLKSKGYKVIGSLLEGAKDYNNVKIVNEKNILILGNEANGISNKIKKILDYKVYIPIKFDSLNVAVAAGILLSKYLRQ